MGLSYLHLPIARLGANVTILERYKGNGAGGPVLKDAS